MGLSPDRVKPKTIKLVFVASPLSKQAALIRRKSKDWLAQNKDVLESGSVFLFLILQIILSGTKQNKTLWNQIALEGYLMPRIVLV